MNKHDVKRKLIIDTAFSEWGKTWFKDTSLSLIHKKLGMTKPALYRYFKNKDQLLTDMRNHFYEDFTCNAERFIESNDVTDTPETVINRFIRIHFKFFMDRIDYLVFFMFFIDIRQFLLRPEIKQLRLRESAIFEHCISEINSDLSNIPHIVSFTINFIYRTAIYFMLSHSRKAGGRKALKFAKDEIEDIIKQIEDLVYNGVASGESLQSFNQENIEKEVMVTDFDIPKRDKLFSAIADVVAKEGLWNTTIAKIAKAVGMTKSSLYFYFSGKMQMFEKLIMTELTKMGELIQNKCKNLQTLPEKLYGYFIVLATYLSKDIRVMLVFHWFHY